MQYKESKEYPQSYHLETIIFKTLVNFHLIIQELFIKHLRHPDTTQDAESTEVMKTTQFFCP